MSSITWSVKSCLIGQLYSNGIVENNMSFIYLIDSLVERYIDKKNNQFGINNNFNYKYLNNELFKKEIDN